MKQLHEYNPHDLSTVRDLCNIEEVTAPGNNHRQQLSSVLEYGYSETKGVLSNGTLLADYIYV